jgi:uncharacterized membrane protein YfcA
MALAILGALIVGLCLGLLGSGGSILTLPILTFLLGMPDKVAIASSLAIVGAISLFAAIPFARAGQVDTRSLLFFGVPSMIGSYLGAYISQFVSGPVQLAIFAGLMLIAAVLMLKPIALHEGGNPKIRPKYKIAVDGLLVGIITGLVGVGGGFMIVPALVLLVHLPMRRAVGTSLSIIALKSLTGFIKHAQILNELDLVLDWNVIAVFSVVGVLGSQVGRILGSKVNQASLKRGFGFFLIAMGIFIVYRTLPDLL